MAFFLQMDVHFTDRWRTWLPVLCAAVLVAGMALGFQLRDTLRNKRDISTVIERNDRLDDLIDLINDKYVDTVDDNKLYKDAVSGILKTLDPHTVYIPADQVQTENEGLEGGFSGIGVEFAIVRDTIEVTSVIENGPARKAGIAVGDQLVRVGDSLVAGVHISTDRIAHLLKGRQKSVVAVSVLRDNRLVEHIAITRDLIPTYSVEASIMIDEHTGYIKINRFTATTIDEFKKALQQLMQSGASQMVVDLRQNPGGYLDAATTIADNFLDNDKLVVFTQGTHVPRTEYRAKDKGLFETGRLAVLMDEGSASASEILAGAIQDWDRGVIVGRRSYGKGLVQEQYELADGAALRLTIARYYTPSGRCIQRSFSKGREAYREDYEKRFEDGELTGSGKEPTGDTTPYYTANRRVVFGGDGISPDVFVPYDTSRSVTLQNLIYSPELKNAIWDYFIRHRQQLKYSSIHEFINSFDGQDQVTGNYLASLDAGTRKVAVRELQKPVNKDFLQQRIKAGVARFLFQDNGYYSISVQDDDVVNRALTILNSDEYSKLIGRK